MTGRIGMAGQTINDRLLAAKHSLAGQGLAKAVCKATTEEMIGPKKKHLDYLVHCTYEPNVSIPQLAILLIERSQNTNWVVVYKALVTVHHMMCYGNERFTQYLASSNSTFQLSNFLDKSGVQGYDMSPFVRRYSRYLNEKAMSYRTVAFDFCKVKRGKEDGMLRTLNADKLLKTIPVLQNQVDALLEFDCSPNDLTNGVINMSFMLLFRDLIKLFACYNDGIINLLEKFFDMNKKQCKGALDIYKKFLVRMDKVGDFLKVAENIGIDKGDIPDLTKAPSSLLDALEEHMNHMEGKKSGSQAQSSSNQKNVKSGVSALSSTSNAFGNVVANGRFDTNTSSIDENLKLQVLAEEEAAMSQFKSKVHSPPANNPFLSSTGSSSKTPQSPDVDMFNTSPSLDSTTSSKASDDLLLQLSNPFMDGFVGGASTTAPVQGLNGLNGLNNGFVSPPPLNNAWIANGNAFVPQPVSPVLSNGSFVSDNNFASVFGNTDSKAAEEITSPPPSASSTSSSSYNPFLVEDTEPPLLLDIHSDPDPKPIQNVLNYFARSRTNSSTFDALGGVLQPVTAGGAPSTNYNNNNNNNTNGNHNSHNNNHSNQGQALLTGDLESSLASLAENLTINTRTVPVKGVVQWNSPKNGGSKASWTPQPMSATTGAGYKPMNQSMATASIGAVPQMYPQLNPMMGMRPLVTSTGMMPQMGGVPSPSTQMGQQSLLFH